MRRVVTASDSTSGAGSSAEISFDRRPWWPWVAALAGLWVVLVHSTLWWFGSHPVPRAFWGDETTYLNAAQRLLAGDPGWWPEALWPPLYPQFLAGLEWLGSGSTGVIIAVQTCLLGLVALLLHDLTRRWTSSRAASLTVAVWVLGYPPLAAFSHYLWPEILHLFFFVALLWVLAVRADRLLWCALGGVALGLAVLSKSLLLFFAPVLLLVALWGGRPVKALGTAAVVIVFAAATVTPTAIANQRRIGRLGIANSATFNLWVGLKDIGRDSFRHDVVWPEFQRWVASADNPVERDRILRSRIRDLVRQQGLAAVLKGQLSKQYFRLFDASCYLTNQLPGGAAQRQSGVGYIGAGSRSSRAVAAVTVGSILLLFVLAPAGLMFGGCRGNRWIRIMVIFIAYNLLLLFWLHVKTRYRVQMLPAAFLGVGCFVAWLEAGCRPRPSPSRVIAYLILITVVLSFALL